MIWIEERHHLISSEIELERTEFSFLRELDEESSKLTNTLKLLSKNECLNRHWMRKTWDQLLLCTNEIQQDLYSRMEIQEFNLISPDQYVVLRSSILKRTHEYIDNFLITRTVNLLEPSAGLRLESNGRLLFHAYAPWIINGEVVGYLEIGKEIHDVLDQLSDARQVGVIIYANKSLLNHATWERWIDEQDQSVDVEWSRFQDFIPVVYSALSHEDQLIPKIGAQLQTLEDAIAPLLFEDQHFEIGAFPLLDEGGGFVGKVAVAINSTQAVENSQKFSKLFTLVTTLFGGMLLLFFYYYLGKIQSKLDHSIQKLQREIAVRHEVANSLKKFSEAIDHTGSAIFITDEKGVIEYVNPRFIALTGYQERDVIGETPYLLNTAEMDQGVYQEMWKTVRSGETWRGDLLNRKKSGEQFWTASTVSPIFDLNRVITNMVSINEDITLIKASQQKIQFLANYDALTQLPNRRLFEETFADSISHLYHRKNDHIALMLIDLDHFKEINDTMGHNAGDQLLVAVAERLTKAIRKGDMAARLGGDEFTVLLDRIESRGNAVIVAEKILQLFQPPVLINGKEIQITCSIGVTLAPDDGDEEEGLMKNADRAMYQAKEEGRNGYIMHTKKPEEKIDS